MGQVTNPMRSYVCFEGFERLRELVASEAVGPYAGRELRPAGEVDAETHVRATTRGFFHPSPRVRWGA